MIPLNLKADKFFQVDGHINNLYILVWIQLLINQRHIIKKDAEFFQWPVRRPFQDILLAIPIDQLSLVKISSCL